MKVKSQKKRSQLVKSIRYSILVQPVDASNSWVYCRKRNRPCVKLMVAKPSLEGMCGGGGASDRLRGDNSCLTAFGPPYYPAPPSDHRTLQVGTLSWTNRSNGTKGEKVQSPCSSRRRLGMSLRRYPVDHLRSVEDQTPGFWLSLVSRKQAPCLSQNTPKRSPPHLLPKLSQIPSVQKNSIIAYYCVARLIVLSARHFTEIPNFGTRTNPRWRFDHRMIQAGSHTTLDDNKYDLDRCGVFFFLGQCDGGTV